MPSNSISSTNQNNLPRKVVVVPYDPEWAFQFLAESDILTNILKDEIVAIHHIGSTAIPGIKAKPIIDILIEARNINQIDQYHQEFSSIGYEIKGEFGIPGRRFIVKGKRRSPFLPHSYLPGWGP